jgi:hypothetical protein
MIAVYICSLLQEVVIILLSFPSLMVAVHMFSFIGSGSHIVIITLTDDSCVYMFSVTGSGSHIVIIPLTDDSCAYMFSFIGSGSHIVIIPLTDGSCVSVLFYRKWFSYCYHSSH